MGGSRSHSEFLYVENRPKIALFSTDSLVNYTVCILFVCTLFKAISYYDLSCSVQVGDGFKKSLYRGWVVEVSSIQFHFGFSEFF